MIVDLNPMMFQPAVSTDASCGRVVPSSRTYPLIATAGLAPLGQPEALPAPELSTRPR